MSSDRPRLYSGEAQHQNFCRMDAFYPVSRLQPAPHPAPFPVGAPLTLPTQYAFEGQSKTTEAFLADTDTVALLVLVDGVIRFEEYFLTGGVDVPWTSWSVAKSFVSALLGIAIHDGLIDSPDDTIERYLPDLSGSAYEGVSLRHVLQMSSGAAWNEDYSDPNSDVNRLAPVMAGHGSLREFVRGIRRGADPGTTCQYNSADTQVLGLLLRAVTGKSLTEYMQAQLCDPLGFEQPGYWLLDAEGVEMALGGLNLSARDFARIGELYRNGGRSGDAAVVPDHWVAASVQADAPHLQQGNVIVGGHVFPLGYGYQWWIPEGSRGEFAAIGVYNQFVYVDPAAGSVIVKLSANRAYGTTPHEASNREAETVAWLRAVNQAVDAKPHRTPTGGP